MIYELLSTMINITWMTIEKCNMPKSEWFNDSIPIYLEKDGLPFADIVYNIFEIDINECFMCHYASGKLTNLLNTDNIYELTKDDSITHNIIIMRKDDMAMMESMKYEEQTPEYEEVCHVDEDKDMYLQIKYPSPYIKCSYNGVEFNGLIDTGSEVSVISYELVKKLGIEKYIDTNKRKLLSGVGEKVTYGYIYNLMIKVNDIFIPVNVEVIDISINFIIGMDVMVQNNIVINIPKKCILINNTCVNFEYMPYRYNEDNVNNEIKNFGENQSISKINNENQEIDVTV